MKGHTDTITSLQVSPDAQSLLSNALDSTVRTWDIRPFAPADRHVKTYDGASAGMEKNLYKASWDVTGDRIAAGGGDSYCTIWETRSAKLLNKLPGHRGAVNDVRFHPQGDPIGEYPWYLVTSKQQLTDPSSGFCLLGPQTDDWRVRQVSSLVASKRVVFSRRVRSRP